MSYLSKIIKTTTLVVLCSFVTVQAQYLSFHSKKTEDLADNAKLLSYMHSRVTANKNMHQGVKINDEAFYIIFHKHGLAAWNANVINPLKQRQPNKGINQPFFKTALQENWVSLRLVKGYVHRITVGNKSFDFKLVNKAHGLKNLFGLKDKSKYPQHSAELVENIICYLDNDTKETYTVEDKTYEFNVLNNVPNAKQILNQAINANYPSLSRKNALIQALTDGNLVISGNDDELRAQIGGKELFKFNLDKQKNEPVPPRQKSAAQNKKTLKDTSTNFNDYQINRQKTISLLKILQPKEVHFTWENPTNNLIINTYDTITYNRGSFNPAPNNANPNLLIDMDGVRIGVHEGRGYILKLLKTAFNGEPLLAAGRGQVTPEFQVQLNCILQNFAKVLAQMTNKEKKRNAVLTLAAAANHCATSIAFNLSQIVTNLSADYLSGCRNMLVAELEQMRKNLLTSAVIKQHPNIEMNSQNAHTFCAATKRFGSYYMLSHIEASQFDDNFLMCGDSINETKAKRYFQNNYTPKSMVRYLQDEFATSTKKYNNKNIRTLMAEWAVSMKLYPNDTQFYLKSCDQEWPQDEYIDVANDKFMLYMLSKIGLIKRK